MWKEQKIKPYKALSDNRRKATLFIRVAKPDKNGERNSLMVQRLGLAAFRAVGLGSVPGWGPKTPQAEMCIKTKQNKKSERKGSHQSVSH